jgi:hypothetical protein
MKGEQKGLSVELSEYSEELAFLPPPDEPAERHIAVMAWLSRFSRECGCGDPILVGCGAVELYISCGNATDFDIIVPEIAKLSAHLLEVGFQRSSDQRFVYHPGHSILFEFPASELQPGKVPVKVTYEGTDCYIIGPVDLIANRLEDFEATGGGIDLIYAYLIYHYHNDRLDMDRLLEIVKRRDIRESFTFVRKLHEETNENKLSTGEQSERLSKECQRRRGLI